MHIEASIATFLPKYVFISLSFEESGEWSPITFERLRIPFILNYIYIIN